MRVTNVVTVYTRHHNTMPRALTADIAKAALTNKADWKSKVTDETTWDDISVFEPEGFKTPMDYVDHYKMKNAKYGDVLKRIIRDMCIKAYDLDNIITHANIGITQKAKAEEDKNGFVTRLLSIMMHLYKIHNNNDTFLNDLAVVPRKDSNKPTSSGWYRIIRDHKAEVAAKVERLNAKNLKAAEEAAQMDKLVKKAQALKLKN